MGIGLSDLPYDGDNGLPAGLWHIRLREAVTENFGPWKFERGLTVQPVNGAKLRRAVAALGPSILGARREDDGRIIGTWPELAMKPASAPAKRSRKPAEPEAAPAAIAAPEPATEPAQGVVGPPPAPPPDGWYEVRGIQPPDPFDEMPGDDLEAFAREYDIPPREMGEPEEAFRERVRVAWANRPTEQSA